MSDEKVEYNVQVKFYRSDADTPIIVNENQSLTFQEHSTLLATLKDMQKQISVHGFCNVNLTICDVSIALAKCVAMSFKFVNIKRVKFVNEKQ